MAGQIGRHYFEAGLGEMYMVPEKQKYLEAAESSILATIREEQSPATFRREPVLEAGGVRRAAQFCFSLLSVTQQLSVISHQSSNLVEKFTKQDCSSQFPASS